MKLRFAAAAAMVFISVPAYAHFHLDSPASFQTQDALGDPQKVAPCGDMGTASNEVTTIMQGSEVAITVTETIFHPGHYRVSIAQTQADLPGEPPVTPGNMACGTVPIDPAPTLPVLADGLLAHTTDTQKVPQTMTVQLPPGMLCDHCVLQVLEFMGEHPNLPPNGCFYHHCAIVNVVANAPDAGVTGGGDDAGTSGNPTRDATGGCSTGAGSWGLGTAMLIVGLTLLLRRRRSTKG